MSEKACRLNEGDLEILCRVFNLNGNKLNMLNNDDLDFIGTIIINQIKMRLANEKAMRCQNELIAYRQQVASIAQQLSTTQTHDQPVEKLKPLTLIDSECKTKLLRWSLDDLKLSVRLRNALFNNGVRTLLDIVLLHEKDILKFQNLATKSIRELKELLTERNLQFGMKLE